MEKIEANDVKIRRELEQFIKCVNGINQNSESFFKSIILSQDSKVEGLEFINEIYEKSNYDKEKLSRSLERLYSVLIAHFK